MQTIKKLATHTQSTPVDFIRHDLAICMMPGLFRSFKSGVKRGELDIVHDFGQGRVLKFSGPEQLGADDLRVLQGLVSLATKSCAVPRFKREAGCLEEPTERAKRLSRASLTIDPVMHGSYAALAREIGHADMDDTRTFRLCIERMCKVSVTTEVRSGQDCQRRSFFLISDLGGKGKGVNGGLHIGLNPQISAPSKALRFLPGASPGREGSRTGLRKG